MKLSVKKNRRPESPSAGVRKKPGRRGILGTFRDIYDEKTAGWCAKW